MKGGSKPYGFEPTFGFYCFSANFKDFAFVFGAKRIYFFWRIHIWRNFWRARTSAHAARQTTLGIQPKAAQKLWKSRFFTFWSALSARTSGRNSFLFSESNSLNIIDDFCTLNESKILKTHNYNWIWNLYFSQKCKILKRFSKLKFFSTLIFFKILHFWEK